MTAQLLIALFGIVAFFLCMLAACLWLFLKTKDYHQEFKQGDIERTHEYFEQNNY